MPLQHVSSRNRFGQMWHEYLIDECFYVEHLMRGISCCQRCSIALWQHSLWLYSYNWKLSLMQIC